MARQHDQPRSKFVAIALATIAVALLCSLAVSATPRFCADKPRYHQLPAKFNDCLKWPNPVSLAGKTLLVLGDVSKHSEMDLGQGRATVKQALAQGMLLMGASNQTAPDDLGYPHFQGDLSNNHTRHAFARWVKKTLYKVYGKTKFDYFHSFIGRMGWIYGQDNSFKTELEVIENNYGAPYDTFDILRGVDYDMFHNTSVIGVHASDGAFIPTGNSFAYEMSKAMLEFKWSQLIFEARRAGSGMNFVLVDPDAVYKTAITCDTFTPEVAVEECLPYTSFRTSPGVCPLPEALGFTTSDDVGQFIVYHIWMNPAPLGDKPHFFAIAAPGPLDDKGGNVVDWAIEYHESDPYCWAGALLEHFGNANIARTLAYPCPAPVGQH